jgi:hypothetical protein
MDLTQLEQYRQRAGEIRLLETRLQELREEGTCIVSDSVSGSGQTFPFTKHTIVIRGFDVRRHESLRRLSEKLSRRQCELIEEQERLEEFIGAISDSAVRQIIELKYIKGLSWASAATRVFGYPDGSRARKRVERYFKKLF